MSVVIIYIFYTVIHGHFVDIYEQKKQNNLIFRIFISYLCNCQIAQKQSNLQPAINWEKISHVKESFQLRNDFDPDSP